MVGIAFNRVVTFNDQKSYTKAAQMVGAISRGKEKKPSVICAGSKSVKNSNYVIVSKKRSSRN